jgi:hypothetical protein
MKTDIIDIVLEQANYCGFDTFEEKYEWLRKSYDPSIAEDWIREDKEKHRIQPQILKMRMQGMIWKDIGAKLDVPMHRAQKIGAPLMGILSRIREKNALAITKAAGDTRDEKVIDDYNYMNDKRTVHRELCALLPIYKELKEMAEVNFD